MPMRLFSPENGPTKRQFGLYFTMKGKFTGVRNPQNRVEVVKSFVESGCSRDWRTLLGIGGSSFHPENRFFGPDRADSRDRCCVIGKNNPGSREWNRIPRTFRLSSREGYLPFGAISTPGVVARPHPRPHQSRPSPAFGCAWTVQVLSFRIDLSLLPRFLWSTFPTA